MPRVLAIILALSVTSASAQVLDGPAMRALERAVEIWRVCPSTGCTQSRSELPDGTVLIWAHILCPPPSLPGAKLDKVEPCVTQREVLRTLDAPKGKPNMRKRVRVRP